jgi:hypothetical protein
MITDTLYQSVNTVVYDGMPTDGYDGHYKEIVIAEQWGFRVVWCMEVASDGTQYTHLYRLEKLRKLTPEQKAMLGPYVAYGLYDVESRLWLGITGIYYSKQEALDAFKEKVFITNHNRGFTDLAYALEQALDGIQFFRQDTYCYCHDCALKVLFNGSRARMLYSLKHNIFKDIEGFSYGLYHEYSASLADTPTYENGVNCSECGNSLLEPLDTDYDEDIAVTGIDPDQDMTGNYDGSIPCDFDAQSM